MTPEEIRAEADGCQQFSNDGKMTKTEVSLIGVLGEIAAQLAELNEHVRSCPIEIEWRRPDGRRPQGAARRGVRPQTAIGSEVCTINNGPER